MSWATQQNPPRPSYSTEMLKHRFVPFGSLPTSENVNVEDVMDVDEPTSVARTKEKTKEKTKKGDEVKTKKRKVDGETSARKSKKSHHTAS